MTDKKTYEGMFLVDAGNPDFEASSQPVRTALERSEAEVLAIKPWDERRLAYEIKGRKRGLYVLTYFKLDPTKVAELERDVELNEGVLRMLLLRRDHMTDEQLNAQTPAMSVDRTAEAGDKDEKAVAVTAPDDEGKQAAATVEAVSESAAAGETAVNPAPANAAEPADAPVPSADEDAGTDGPAKEQ